MERIPCDVRKECDDCLLQNESLFRPSALLVNQRFASRRLRLKPLSTWVQ